MVLPAHPSPTRARGRALLLFGLLSAVFGPLVLDALLWTEVSSLVGILPLAFGGLAFWADTRPVAYLVGSDGARDRSRPWRATVAAQPLVLEGRVGTAPVLRTESGTALLIGKPSEMEGVERLSRRVAELWDVELRDDRDAEGWGRYGVDPGFRAGVDFDVALERNRAAHPRWSAVDAKTPEDARWTDRSLAMRLGGLFNRHPIEVRLREMCVGERTIAYVDLARIAVFFREYDQGNGMKIGYVFLEVLVGDRPETLVKVRAYRENIAALRLFVEEVEKLRGRAQSPGRPEEVPSALRVLTQERSPG